MVDYIKLQKGLDLPLEGAPEQILKEVVASDSISIKPTDFKGVVPRLSVREGDTVKAGSPIFTDKLHEEVKFTSPVSGTVEKIVRGEKRKLLEIRIKADAQIDYLKFDIPSMESLDKKQVTSALLESGLWAAIIQRPYGIIANPEDTPKSIFISGFHTAPLAADVDFTLKDEISNIQVAIDALNKLTKGGIHIGLSAKTHASSPLHKLKDVNYHIFDGPHPAGNVGVQIHHVSPINKGEIVWTVNVTLLAAIGKLFSKGIYDMTRIVAVGGPRVSKPCYIKCLPGQNMSCLSDMTNNNVTKDQKGCGIRYISGDVLSGTSVGANGSLSFYDDQISLITEGNYYEAFGWAKPARAKKFSFYRSYFSWLTPKKKFAMDSNLNGEVRAFVLTGNYEKVLPMDILPVYLLKAIIVRDIDKMEELGIYEVVPEDFALCEYISEAKIEIQAIIEDGINLMIKEMS
ncbi:MAG: Na(+)-translocating NADH-quinone reductase subunit A [Bacteroidales bacterium]